MLETLRIALRLQSAYTMNSIQYYVRKIPLIKRLFFGMSYDIPKLKMIFGILGIFIEACEKILFKLAYVLFLVFVTVMLADYIDLPDNQHLYLFTQIFVFSTLIGGLLNNTLFDTERADYYAVVLLRMDGKKYLLSQYIFYHIYSTIILIIAFMTVGNLAVNMPIIYAPVFALFIVCVKLAAAGLVLMKEISKVKTYYVSNYIIASILLAICIGLPIAGIIFPLKVMLVIMFAFIIPALFGIYKIYNYKYYNEAYHKLINGYMQSLSTAKDAKTKATIEQSRDNLVDDAKATSKKSGYAYMHELFVKRHKKLLWKPALITTAIATVTSVVTVIGIILFPPFKEMFSTSVLNLLPPLVFFMYFINRGLPFTQALYVNCDHSMLTYSFYKRPGVILRLFIRRLISIIKINLLPALVIGLGLSVIQFEVCPVKNPADYVVLIVSSLSLSVFFSVHYMVIYYLLQPYNVATEIVSPAYSFVKWLTYFVCYMIMIQVHVSSVAFGIGTICFCILYCIIAGVLVYFFAPKTFHIKS